MIIFNQTKFFFKTSEHITQDNKHILEKIISLSLKFIQNFLPISFINLTPIRDVPSKEQLALKEDYERIIIIFKKT